MATQKGSITIDRGTTQNYTFNYYGSSGGTTKRSLVGAIVFFTVKPKEYDDDATDNAALIKKNIPCGADTVSGSVQFAINPADTQNIDPGTFFYDLKVREASGAIYKIAEGQFIIDASPTNRQS